MSVVTKARTNNSYLEKAWERLLEWRESNGYKTVKGEVETYEEFYEWCLWQLNSITKKGRYRLKMVDKNRGYVFGNYYISNGSGCKDCFQDFYTLLNEATTYL